MHAMRSEIEGRADRKLRRAEDRVAFTLIEILLVVTIIGILVALMGTVVRNSVRKAREAATVAIIQKIEGLLDERAKGFERATKSRDFQRVVETITNQLLQQSEDINGNGTLDPGEDLNGNGVIDRGVIRISPKVIEVIARKEYFRQYFPQRFEELAPNSSAFPPTTVLPAVMASDPQITFVPTAHRRRTESSALLYYSLTRMHAFGVPPVGESEFGTTEVRDTDGDGLLEFVDAWGQPLRFYRWPTRLLKPNGPYGIDGMPAGGTFATYGGLGTDDVVVPTNIRQLAGLLISGLVSGPAVPGQWDVLSEDPDDPYGLIMTELKRQFATGVQACPSYPIGSQSSSSRYQEPFYPTLDTYHTPLIISVGSDGVARGDALDTVIETGLGLFEPWEGTDTNGDGIPDSDLGILAQPRGLTISGGQYVIPTNVFDAFTDNITNRNRRAGKGK